MATEHTVYARFINELNLIPLRGVSLYDSVNDKALHFLQIDSESSWNITAITRKSGKGRTKTIGYNVDATIYPLVNNLNYYENRLPKLLTHFANNRFFLQFLLGKTEPHYIDNQSAWTINPPEIIDTFNGTYPNSYLTYPLNGDDPVLAVTNATDKMVLNFGTNLSLVNKIEQAPLRPRITLSFTGYVRDIIDVSAYDETLTNTDKLLFR